MQAKIRCVLMRGGTSKGLFFREEDLPRDPARRELLLLRAMGSPDPRQIDGLGGSYSTTSKVAIIAAPEGRDGTISYTFGQVSILSPFVDYRGNCGNLSAAVGPYAIDEGLVTPVEPVTQVRILNTNTEKMILAEVPVRGGRAEVEGDLAIAGVPGTGAPIRLGYEDPGGAVTGRLLPTGQRREPMALPDQGEVEVSILDAANPVVFVKARDLGLKGTESPEEIDANPSLLSTLELIRSLAAERCGLVADYREASARSPAVPKVALVACPPEEGPGAKGEVHLVARIMSMGRAHRAYALTGAVATAVAAKVRGTVVNEVARRREDCAVALRHPSGAMTLEVFLEEGGEEPRVKVVKALRTARRLMEGFLLVPEGVLKG